MHNQQEKETVVKIIREHCPKIGRPFLNNIRAKEIKITSSDGQKIHVTIFPDEGRETSFVLHLNQGEENLVLLK